MSILKHKRDSLQFRYCLKAQRELDSSRQITPPHGSIHWHIITMEKFLVTLLAFPFLNVIPARAEYGYWARKCYFNGETRSCIINHGINRPKAGDVDIIWPDGETTSVVYLRGGAPSAGDSVIINGETHGIVTEVWQSRDSPAYIEIRSRTGNVFSFPPFID